MHKPLYVYSSSNFHHAIKQELPALKPILLEASGKKIRRIDRLTQLALIGSFQCKPKNKLPEKTGLYMSSIFCSPNNSSDVLSDIYIKGQLPRPLNFINTVGNAACFYLSQQLGLSANNQFISRDYFALEAVLKHASIDLEIGNIDAAFVGIVSEADKNLDTYRARLHVDEKYQLAEGSHWLYLSHYRADANAIAKITHIIEPINEQDIINCLQSVTNENNMATQISFSDTVSTAQKEKIFKNYEATEASYAPEGLRHEFVTALHICGFLEACKIQASSERLIYLDTNNSDQWSMMVIEA